MSYKKNIKKMLEASQAEFFCMKELKVLREHFDWSSKIAMYLNVDEMLAGIYPHIEALFRMWIDFAKDGINPDDVELLEAAYDYLDRDDKFGCDLCKTTLETIATLPVDEEEVNMYKNYILYEAPYVRLVKIYNHINDRVFSVVDLDCKDAFKIVADYADAFESESLRLKANVETSMEMMKAVGITSENAFEYGL